MKVALLSEDAGGDKILTPHTHSLSKHKTHTRARTKFFELIATQFLRAKKEKREMTVKENKAMVRRFIESINKRNLAVIDELYAANYVLCLPSGREIRGPEGLKQLITWFLSAFPDFHINIEDLIAEEDKVVFRSTRSGTHKGEWLGIAATGKQVTWTYISIWRIEGGKIVEEWGEGDYLGMRRQLGDIPSQ